MEFKTNIKFDGLFKDLEDRMLATARQQAERSISNFFSRVVQTHDPLTYKTGAGLAEIEDMIIKKYADEEFQEKLTKYFDDNWEKIFARCMERALQHKANGIAFNKMHTLTIDKI